MYAPKHLKMEVWYCDNSFLRSEQKLEMRMSK